MSRDSDDIPWGLRRPHSLRVRHLVIFAIIVVVYGIIVFTRPSSAPTEYDLQNRYACLFWMLVGILSVIINVIFDHTLKRIKRRKAKNDKRFYEDMAENIPLQTVYVLGDDGEIIEIVDDEKPKHGADSTVQ